MEGWKGGSKEGWKYGSMDRLNDKKIKWLSDGIME